MSSHAFVRASLLLAVFLAACGGDDEDGGTPPPVTRFDAGSPDAGPPLTTTSCTGEPSPCDAFDFSVASECAAHSGCVDDRKCRANFAFSCFSLTTYDQCTEVGCAWAEECTGGGVCFTNRTPSECQAAGCTWDSYCDPLSNPSDVYCEQYDAESSCAGDTACEWGYLTCSGTPAPCNTRLDEAACNAHEGCTWTP